MGILAFEWGDNELTLFQNREKRDSWVVNPLAWDEEEKILRSLPSNFGTWFGISKNGRVAFLVDSMLNNDLCLPWLRPVDFLRGVESPWQYANALSERMAIGEIMQKDLVYEMIVADINSNSMCYISKKDPMATHAVMEVVGFGVHTLSSTVGLDSQSPKELRYKDLFEEVVGNYRNEKKPPLNLMAQRFMYDPTGADKSGFSCSSSNLFEIGEPFRTIGTNALAVKPNKEVMLHERYFENDDWKDRDFTFNLDYD